MNEDKDNFAEDTDGLNGGLFPNILKNFRERKSWQIGAVVLAGLLLALYLGSGRKGNKSAKVEDIKIAEREVFKEKDLKQVLNQMEAQKDEKGRVKTAIQKERRNYATEMAVFVFTEKEKRGPESFPQKTANQKLGIPAGTKIDAYIAGTLFSFNVAAPVIAVVSKDAQKDGRLVIPKDSKFLGEAGVLKSLNRINVSFNLLILPDGRQIRVHAMALSEDGSSGIKGRVDKRRDMKVLKAIGETALAGASLFVGGVRNEPFALEDQVRMNLAQNFTQEARQDLRTVNVETSITVDSYTPIQVILLEAI